LIEEKKKVTIIDQGYNTNTQIKKKDLGKKTYHPKIIKKDFHYVNYNFKKKNKILENNFSSLGSLAVGGLSNVWGGGYWERNKNKVNIEINKFLDKNFKIINFDSENSTKLTNYLNNNITSVNYSNADLLSLKNENEVYNSKKTIEKLKNEKNFSYLGDVFIDNIKKTGDNYTLIDDIGNEYNCRKLILACGTLGSTRLIIKMNNLLNKKIKLCHNLNYGFVGFLKNKIKYNISNNHSASSVFFFNRDSSQIKISGSIGRFNNELKNMIKKKFFFPFGYFINFFINFFKNNIVFGNIFFPTEFSNSNIHMDDSKNLIINGGENVSLKLEKEKTIKEFFFRNKKSFNNIYLKSFPIGSDAHYTSTMTKDSNLKELRTDDHGELLMNRNLFITDASILPSDGPHFPTFQIMVNSYKLGKYIAKLDD